MADGSHVAGRETSGGSERGCGDSVGLQQHHSKETRYTYLNATDHVAILAATMHPPVIRRLPADLHYRACECCRNYPSDCLSRLLTGGGLKLCVASAYQNDWYDGGKPHALPSLLMEHKRMEMRWMKDEGWKSRELRGTETCEALPVASWRRLGPHVNMESVNIWVVWQCCYALWFAGFRHGTV